MGAERPARAAVRAALRDALADLEPGDRIVVALSGGADSLALTAGAAAVSAELGLLCEAIVVDHQLQRGSAAVAARAAEQARLLGCADVRVVTVDVPHGPGTGGVEAAARAARYAALDTAAAGSDGPASVPVAAAVLLGHTREDQAETVLLGLARGSGTRSLAGMRARSGRYRRPLLDLPRDVVAAASWAAAESDPRLEPWTDPHNGDPTYARVRVRSQVLPLLESTLGPGIVEALARTAALAREDADALDDWAGRVWAQI
ncbi:MAG: tRNA lysidine(34) synthetase TilS, partial [Actinomycetota bacterium]|nr:tRNA lysidine(34) synthetase TilS [Actinomycetota bacterium]